MTLVYAKIIGMFLCGEESWGRGGGWRLGGGTWKFPNLSRTHRWLPVGAGGVNLCTYVMYVHTFVHFCDKKLRSRSTYFEKICGSPLQVVRTPFKSKSWIKNWVNYFTCMQHFSCRWYGPLEVYLN